MLERHEAFLSGQQENDLFYQTWTLPHPAEGTVVISHGLAEHSDCYHRLALNLGDWGWNTVAWDLRGHGQSSGKRGCVSNILEMSRDLRTLSQLVTQSPETTEPLVLFGHSLGGQICLRGLLEYGNMGFSALVLSSPALGLKVKVPAYKERLARWVSDWIPELTMHNELDYRDLSRDENQLRAYETDPLRHDKISPRLYLGMLENFEEIPKRAQDIQIPTLMQLAGQDRIVDSHAAQRLFEQMGSELKVLRIYHDSHHEIYNDFDRDEALKDLKDFLSRIKKQKSNKSKINLSRKRV